MQAFYLARTGRPGPVLVDIPKDVQQSMAVPDWNTPMAIAGYMRRLPPSPAPSQISAIVRALHEVSTVKFFGAWHPAVCQLAGTGVMFCQALTNWPRPQTMGSGLNTNTQHWPEHLQRASRIGAEWLARICHIFLFSMQAGSVTSRIFLAIFRTFG